jgi:uncharacterized protein YdeI (BOF family)
MAAGAATLASLAVPAVAETPSSTDNGEWLTLSGSVVSVGPERFVLDYGNGTIPVEMDDYDWFNENAVVAGDHVTVTGRMDADFWENKSIEANSVYVASLNTVFRASAADEEGATVPVWTLDPLTAGESVSFSGTVKKIDGDEMTVDAGLFDYTVDTSPLDYDPLDSDGVQRIAVGDRVLVSGRMDDTDLFDGGEIDAKALVELG